MLRVMLLLAGWALVWPAPLDAQPPTTTRAFLTGVDTNYSLELAGKGTLWSGSRTVPELLDLLARNGADAFRVRLWTGNEGVNGRAYATELALRAQAAGLRPYLVLFLSENWSDYVKQPAPEAWRAIPREQKLKLVEQYGETTARHFIEAGVKTDLYAVGNEIDFGICGEFEEEWANRFSLDYMRQRVWPRAAEIIAAAQRGIRRANPNARFIVHLAQWWNPDYVIAHLRAMKAGGVQVNFVGLSFFPSSGLSPQNRFADLDQSIRRIHDAVDRPIIVCEFAYPSEPRFGGQFAAWNKPVEGYPLDEAGQQKWIADFLSFCRHHEQVAGAFYWSPEWYPEEMWRAFSLFRQDGQPKPGLSALKPTRR